MWGRMEMDVKSKSVLMENARSLLDEYKGKSLILYNSLAPCVIDI